MSLNFNDYILRKCLHPVSTRPLSEERDQPALLLWMYLHISSFQGNVDVCCGIVAAWCCWRCRCRDDSLLGNVNELDSPPVGNWLFNETTDDNRGQRELKQQQKHCRYSRL